MDKVDKAVLDTVGQLPQDCEVFELEKAIVERMSPEAVDLVRSLCTQRGIVFEVSG